MNIVCLCPTYGRPPELLANTIALFERQDYPAELRWLVLFDDLGNIAQQSGPRETCRRSWTIVSKMHRLQSLPHKYEFLLRFVRANAHFRPDAFCLWDDDDIYLSHHLSAHVRALQEREWSHPLQIRSLYKLDEKGLPFVESAAGRFHGALAARESAVAAVGGWLGVMPPGEERRADFDQRFLGALAHRFGEPGRPDAESPPSYVYGWTRALHCSGLMSSPANQDWYQRHAPAFTGRIERIEPRLDEQSAAILAALERPRD